MNSKPTHWLIHPCSPFEQSILPAHDASKVKVSGPGIDDGVPASLPTEFTVDTTDAGVADLDVAIQVSVCSQLYNKI